MEKNNSKIIVSVIGPESTGKSTLCQQLSQHFNMFLVEEYAREYLKDIGLDYTMDDIDTIAFTQQQKVDNAVSTAVIQDTNPITFYIWQEYKYGLISPMIKKLLKEKIHHFTLLCQPDLPWEEDPLRENPNDREQIFQLHKKILEENNITYKLVKGEGDERFENARRLLEKYLFNNISK